MPSSPALDVALPLEKAGCINDQSPPSAGAIRLYWNGYRKRVAGGGLGRVPEFHIRESFLPFVHPSG